MKIRVFVEDGGIINDRTEEIEIQPGSYIAYAYASEGRSLKSTLKSFENFRVDGVGNKHKTYVISQTFDSKFEGYETFEFGDHIMRTKFLVVAEKPFEVVQFGDDSKDPRNWVDEVCDRKETVNAELVLVDIVQTALNFIQIRNGIARELGTNSSLIEKIIEILKRDNDDETRDAMIVFINALCISGSGSRQILRALSRKGGAELTQAVLSPNLFK